MKVGKGIECRVALIGERNTENVFIVEDVAEFVRRIIGEQ